MIVTCPGLLEKGKVYYFIGQNEQFLVKKLTLQCRRIILQTVEGDRELRSDFSEMEDLFMPAYEMGDKTYQEALVECVKSNIFSIKMIDELLEIRHAQEKNIKALNKALVAITN